MKIMFSTFWKWPYDSAYHLGTIGHTELLKKNRLSSKHIEKLIVMLKKIFLSYLYTRNKPKMKLTVLFTVSSKRIEKLQINF